MKKNIGKWVSFICALSLLISITPVSAVEVVSPSTHELLRNERRDAVFSQKFESMQPADISQRITISNYTTRELTDFSGNAYTLVECNPTGYLIYHDSSGVFAEASLSSPSPYASFSGPIYYNGPTNYYALVSGELVHTITGEKLNSGAVPTQYSEKINDILLQQKDTAVLNYIDRGTPYANTMSTRVSNNIYVEDYTLIRGLTTRSEIGYKDGGYCGYIAGAMATLYLQVHSGLILIPSQYLSSSGFAFKNDSFTSLLASYGFSHSTTASTLASALNDYFDDNNYIVSANWSLFGSANTTRSYIDNDQPVMVGGGYASDPNDSSSSTVAHFILAYGYGPADNSSSSYFIVHYGWPDYSEVQINNGLFILQSADYVVLKITP